MTLNGIYIFNDKINFKHSNISYSLIASMLLSIDDDETEIDEIKFDTINKELSYRIDATYYLLYSNNVWVTPANVRSLTFDTPLMISISKEFILFVDNLKPSNNELFMMTYKYGGDARVVNKFSSLNSPNVIVGAFTKPSNINNLEIDFESYNIIDFNYVYIPILNRFYFLETYTILAQGLIRLFLHCDVLYTFSDTIYNSSGYVERTSDSNYYNNYIIDTESQELVDEEIEIIDIEKGTSGKLIDSTSWDITKEVSPLLLSVVRGTPH